MSESTHFSKNTAIIIPVYNECKVIEGVVNNVLKHFETVVCVNDGSKDNSWGAICNTKAHGVNHIINMGQGAALQTGLEYAKTLPEIEYFVTFDADGQHKIADVQLMLERITAEKVDIALGSRFLGTTKNMPKVKRVLLKTALFVSNTMTGMKLTDVHNGLRVLSRRAATEIEITLPGMAHASEITDIIRKNKISFVEVPVTIEYSEYSMSKGQPMVNSINILFDTFMKGLKR